MPRSDGPPRHDPLSGDRLPRPGHGHRSIDADPVDSRPDANIADPHPSWLKRWRSLRAGLNKGEDSQQVRELRDKIAQTPAGTLAGLQAQAELIAELAWNDVVATTARQLITGLKRQQRARK